MNRVRLLLAIAGCVHWAATAASVSACSTPSLENAASPVTPKNGIVWVQLVHCMPPGGGCHPGEAAEDLEVIDTVTGEAVPGEVLHAEEGYVIWKPDGELIEQRTYEITTYDRVLTFTAGPAISLSANDVQIAEPRVRSGARYAESIVCVDEERDSCGVVQARQLATQRHHYVSAEIEVGTVPDDFTSFGHYLVRARWFTE